MNDLEGMQIKTPTGNVWYVKRDDNGKTLELTQPGREWPVTVMLYEIGDWTFNGVPLKTCYRAPLPTGSEAS